MTDEPDSLVLRSLRKLDEKIDRLDEGQAEAAVELRSITTHMSPFLRSELARDSSNASILARLDKIERRLDLNN